MSKRATSASDVLDKQRRLYAQLGEDVMTGYFDEFFTNVAMREKERLKGKDGWMNIAAQVIARMIHPAGTPAEYMGLLRKDLFAARTFQVTAEMVDAVNELYVETRKRISHFSPPEVPSPHGFVWFDKSPGLVDVNGKKTRFRAMSWGVQPVGYYRENEGEGARRTGMGVRVTLWSWTGDIDDNWTEQERAWWRKSAPQGSSDRLIMLHAVVMPFEERFGGYADVTSDDFISWVHSLWLMMDTEIVATSRPGIRRLSMRKFQESMSAPPEVNVIRLRRIVSPSDPDAEHVSMGPVSWRFRWIVQGHLRHLEGYEGTRHHAVADSVTANTRCAVCGGRVTWVKAHVKGPDNKPLRSVEQLYRLQR